MPIHPPQQSGRKRLGFFTRVLDRVAPAERYRLAAEQIRHAEQFGFDSAWVAQHHFHEGEGGLPAPFVFLAHVAALTSRIRLGTGIVTLPLESPIRAAEDAAVLDLLSGGRLEFGVGAGGNPSAFAAFGLDPEIRGPIFGRHLDILRDALAGRPLPGGDVVYPAHPPLGSRLWQATFSVEGGERAGRAGDGLLLSRTQPRPKDAAGASLADLQVPIIDAYLAALPAGCPPRILGSRTVFVAEDRLEAARLAEIGLGHFVDAMAAAGRPVPGPSLADRVAAFDVHLGTAEDVVSSLRSDRTLDRVTDVAVQVHAVDPPHAAILRSIELVAEHVAPALGWTSRPASLRSPERLSA